MATLAKPQTEKTVKNEVSYGQLSAFFIPLALQTITQGSTHAIVAMVASRGPGGVLNYAGLTQAAKIMFFLGSFGAGLLTAGMVYGASRQGYAQFGKVYKAIITAIMVLHCLLCLPPVSRFIFGTIIGLPPEIELPARQTFIFTVPLQLLFFLRIPYFSVLFLKRATGQACFATIGRVVLTLLLAMSFVQLKFVGPIWAMICMIIPVIVELTGLYFFARPHIRTLPEHNGPLPGIPEIVHFSFVFSIGKLLIGLSEWIMVAIISRAPEPERMLPVFAVTASLAGPVAFGASRTQALFVSFGGSTETNRKIRKFAIVAGIILGSIPLAFILPYIGYFYYVVLQKVPSADLLYVRLTALALFPFPFLVAIRSFAEGNAAVLRRPSAVLTGQSAYLGLTVVAAFCAFVVGVPGSLIGPVGLWAGNLGGTLFILMVLRWERIRQLRTSLVGFWAREG